MDAIEQPQTGGRYEIRDGKRVLVEEATKDHPEGNRARPAQPEAPKRKAASPKGGE